MAGDWIKIEQVTPDKPEVDRIASALGIDPDAVVGKLVRLWIWADQQSVDGNGVSVTKTLLDRITYAPGFADCLMAVGWLEMDGAGFRFPNFDRHNGQSSKNRAVTNRRVTKHRVQCNAGIVTDVTQAPLQKALPEKRIEEKSNTPIAPKGARKKESSLPTSPEAIALAEMFHRKATTPWTAVETRKFKSLMPIDPDDLASLKEYYDYHWPPERDVNVLRHDLKTLLNNFPGEVDRAKVWESKPSPTNPYSAAPLFPTNRNGSLFS
jgi:hypothetical protein